MEIHIPAPIAATAVLMVKELTESDHDRWDKYVYAHPKATFFHRAGWKHVIEKAFGHRTYFYYVEQGGAITGVLPMAEMKSRLFGHSLSSLPFCAYGGILADDEAVRVALESAARALAQELNVDYLELRNLEQVHGDWPAKRDLYVTFRKPILPDVESNLGAIPRKQRAMVRKGIKAGLTSELDEGVERFFDVFADNVHRHGTPALPRKYFSVLRDVFGKDCSVMSVLKDGQVVSSVLSFFFRNEILPYYAGDMPEARDLAANDFKYWELMRRACEAGYTLFDYGRSKVGTGPYHFKKNWGFEPQPLHYEFQLLRSNEIPDVNPLNPKYQLFIGLWRKLPLAVANRVGPHIVKYLG
ncbi:MAG: FemAB family XrtA/PEP-CTERM system-associated protein [Thiobacillaceae bacterium]